MSDTLFTVLTTRCFYGCGHTTTEATTTGSSDAMERHHWDAHYSPAERDKFHKTGQRPERTGRTENDPLACRSCGARLVERPAKDQTPEQSWCGAWYDHPPVPRGACGKITSSVLIMSEALKAQHHTDQAKERRR